MMLRFLSASAVAAVLSMPLATGALAQTMSEDQCETTASIVSKAQDMRVEGETDKRVTRKLTREYAELGEGYTETAIPQLVSFVYMQPEAVLADNDLSEVWKQVCLTTDLSSVFPSE